MTAGAASLLVTFLFVGVFKFVSAVVINIPAVSGQTAILSCRTQNKSIIVVEWSRPDLKNEYVLFYRDEQFDPDNQHPSFKNRVDLRDRQMKDGDVSLVLKDVTINDTGTYKCRVFMRGTNHKKRAILETESICIINLSVFDPPDQKNITTGSGQNIILPCRAPHNKTIVIEWNRSDLEAEYVLFYRGEQFDPEHQHPSFKNRVDLRDRQMKDGDVSLVLKDVTINDTGTYKCRVFMRGTNHKKRAILETDPISIIYLSVVDPPGQPGGSVGLIVGLSLSAVLLVALVFFIHRRWKQQRSQGY